MKIFSIDKIDYQKVYWFVLGLIGLSILFSFRGILKYILLWFIQLGYSPINIPILIGDPLSIPYFIEPIFSFCLFIFTWLISTKIKKLQELKYRYAILGICFFGITFQYLWSCSASVVRTLIPYFYLKKELLFVPSLEMQSAFLQNFDNLMLFILSFPLIFLLLTYYWLFKFINAHWDQIKELFKTWEYDVTLPAIAEIFLSSDKQRKIASEIGDKFKDKSKIIIPTPDVELGPNVKKNIMVYIPGLDRTLNLLIVGAIGVGKTAAQALPLINQDLHYMTFMINNFRKFYKDKNYISEEIRGALLNGITVIEPSNDLCKKVYKLAKAHGIPDEAITYIDPTNPDTPSLNIFNGPVDKVAEMFTMVISGIGEKTEFFFEQSQRTHLKNHIYLLMENDPDKKVGFSDLITMYNDPQLVWRMMKKLEERIPQDIDNIEDRDTKNYWLILKTVKAWFDDTYIVAKSGFGKNMQIEIVQSGPYKGEYRIIDTKSEHVVGLRNILDDIGKNVLMRRVLFSESNFNFDKFLEFGGILLVNTAKGELSTLSNVLGKFALLCYQNAVFRREPMTSSYNALYCDEFPDYIYDEFSEFPAQSRKYKAIINVICQTTAQLEKKYGKPWKTTLLATLRNKMLFGDATKEDAEEFSLVFGTKEVFEESESTQEVSAMMDNPSNRVGLSYKKTEKEVLKVSDIIYQKAFECAVKIVKNNEPIPGQIIKANFVPKNEFKEATVKVIPEEATYWLKVIRDTPIRKNFVMQDEKHQQFIEEAEKDMAASNNDPSENKLKHSPSQADAELTKLLLNVEQKPIEKQNIRYDYAKQKRTRYIHKTLSPSDEIDTIQQELSNSKSEVATTIDPLVVTNETTSEPPIISEPPIEAQEPPLHIKNPHNENIEQKEQQAISFDTLFDGEVSFEDTSNAPDSTELKVTAASNEHKGVIHDPSVLNNQLINEWTANLKTDEDR
ncbi:TPA: TraM recognition domain-containing protein [Bacillus paranthracis]|nr:TraM recognition domain-containing protein [Bacillus cytotoxicus]HDR7766774.1 TraM recognition domain-containing protein [Bacillus paranthracis]